MIQKIAIAAGFAVVLAAGYSFAGTPFGGDDTGFVPPVSPKSDTAKCEIKVARNVRKAIDCIIKCHIDRAALKTTDDTGEVNCETADVKKSCFAKYAKAREDELLNQSRANTGLLGTAAEVLGGGVSAGLDSRTATSCP